MNSAHNGHRLGVALFKACERLGIAHKIGWVTCDNASNNAVMMTRFADMVQQATGKELDATKRRIRCVSCFMCYLETGSDAHLFKRCLAHIINLATQAVISRYSKSKYFNPENPNDDLMSLTTYHRDEVGLIQTIAVKVRYCVLVIK